MRKNFLAIALSASTLLAACDRKPEPLGQSRPKVSTTEASAASTASAPSQTSVSDPAALSPSLAPAVSATPSASASPSEEPEEVAGVNLPKPKGVEFVPREKWQAQEPMWDTLEKMDHAENAPILDLIIMHAVVLTTVENEQQKLQGIQFYHMDQVRGRKFGDISAHYIIGPSGKVYEGRDLRYRPEAIAGSGMGRFGDPWNKCVVMMLGDFNLPEQVFTDGAKKALKALIEDRKQVFEQKYRFALDAREAETKALRGNAMEGRTFGLDVVRVRQHPTLPSVIRSFLDNKTEPPAQDAGIPAVIGDAGIPVVVLDGGASDATMAGDGGAGSP